MRSGEGSGRVPEKWDPGDTEKGPGEYRKGGIRTCTGKVGSGKVPERWDPGKYRKDGIWASTGKGRIRQVLEKGPVEYRKGGIRVNTGEGSG